MDISNPAWHGRLEIAGIAGETELSGSIISMSGQILAILKNAKSRTNGEGHKIIQITLSDAPIIQARLDDLKRVREVESFIDPSLITPAPAPLQGESFVEMVKRLVASGEETLESADEWARMAFGYPANPDRAKRLADPKVQLFLRLNSSDRAASEADPKEYSMLKTYIKDSYPDYFQLLTPRR